MSPQVGVPEESRADRNLCKGISQAPMYIENTRLWGVASNYTAALPTLVLPFTDHILDTAA